MQLLAERLRKIRLHLLLHARRHIGMAAVPIAPERHRDGLDHDAPVMRERHVGRAIHAHAPARRHAHQSILRDFALALANNTRRCLDISQVIEPDLALFDRAAIENFRNTLAQNMNVMIFFNVLFSSVIAFGVIYNAARISLSERSRELATLRVIGFGRDEISLIFLGEIAVITLLAIPFGLVLGYAFAAVAVVALGTESQRFPLVVSAATFAFAVTTVIVAAVLSSLVVRRHLDRLDLLAVLKAAT